MILSCDDHAGPLGHLPYIKAVRGYFTDQRTNGADQLAPLISVSSSV